VTLRGRLEVEFPRDRLAEFDLNVGPDSVLRPLLDEMQNRPTISQIEALHRACRGASFLPCPDSFHRTLQHAVASLDRETPLIRTSAARVLDELLKLRSSGVAGWPDPPLLGRRLLEDIQTGRLTVTGHKVHTRIFEPETVSAGPSEGRESNILVRATRHDLLLKVEIENRSNRAVALNPLLDRYGLAYVIEAGDTWDGRILEEREIHLTLGGWIWCHMVTLPASSLVVLRPGSKHVYEHALASGRDLESRVFVSISDRFPVAGELPVPRLVHATRVEAR
jgi:hypothetical protein